MNDKPIKDFFREIDRIALFGPTPEMIAEHNRITKLEQRLAGIILKECKFCGSPFVELDTKHHQSGDPYTWAVHCRSCHATGPSVGEYDKFRVAIDAKLEAVRLWNV